jgi:hypothetical protein
MRIAIPGTDFALTLTRRTALGSSHRTTYSGDGLIVHSRILDCLESERFRSAYAAGMQTPHLIGGGGDLRIHWRVYTCLWAAEHALRLPGDLVECGVNTGVISRAICEYVQFASVPKRFFLFDTFAGIPEDQASTDERDHVRSKNARIYRECYETTKETFAPFPNVMLVQGRVPESLATVAIEQVAYLSIDMNLVLPEMAALDHFWDRLVPGAIVVLDDYGFEGHRAQHEAIDSFAARRGVPVYTSPTGQGLIIRPPS